MRSFGVPGGYSFELSSEQNFAKFFANRLTNFWRSGNVPTFPTNQIEYYIRLTGLRNSHYFFGDFLRRKNKIYTPACYSALWHIGLLGCIWLLCDGYTPNFFYAAQRFRTITIVAGDNNSYEFTFPMFCYGTQKHCNYVGPSPRLRNRF